MRDMLEALWGSTDFGNVAKAGENYGIDAPTVVRNLGVGGAALVIIGLVLPH
jgi:hypothetical protein